MKVKGPRNCQSNTVFRHMLLLYTVCIYAVLFWQVVYGVVGSEDSTQCNLTASPPKGLDVLDLQELCLFKGQGEYIDTHPSCTRQVSICLLSLNLKEPVKYFSVLKGIPQRLPCNTALLQGRAVPLLF